MPILEREVDIFPEDLLVRDLSSLSSDAGWRVVYTRSRQEKSLMRSLHEMEIPYFCPVIPHKSRSPGGRARTSYIPLFPNYVFMHCDGEARYRALQTNAISQILDVQNGSELTKDLRQIHRLLQLGIPLSVERRLQPGARVRINRGPLKGFEGVILQRQDQAYLYVAVDFLQQGASVRLVDYEVEPIA